MCRPRLGGRGGVGTPGAGKSTLGNRLLGEDLLATGAVRGRDGKGRHTTAWRELLPLPHGGVLLDTRACVAWACTTPAKAWSRPSPNSPKWPGTAGSRTAPTPPNRAARCWPPSRTVASPGGASTATTGCGARTPTRPPADAALRTEREWPKKQIARHVRALKQSPHFKA
ncbi:GTPase RsgA [Streptomyces sp. NPDC086080]|uniref:GTPase RsgA n=1 Tax=Streptomyces sp. NPDC086080 TaxID=3365748 RepID=UPI0037D4782D